MLLLLRLLQPWPQPLLDLRRLWTAEPQRLKPTRALGGPICAANNKDNKRIQEAPPATEVRP